MSSLYKIVFLHEAPASYSLLLSIMNAIQGDVFRTSFCCPAQVKPVYGQLTAGRLVSSSGGAKSLLHRTAQCSCCSSQKLPDLFIFFFCLYEFVNGCHSAA